MLRSNYNPDLMEAGCDETGRGCLAGPVMAAAVILPKDYFHPELNDSKLLSYKKRESIRKEIEKEAISWAFAMADNKEIDQINILNASYLAMHRAIKKLNPRPQYLLIDGNRFNPFDGIEHKCIIKGDSKYFSIAAASVIAKCYRDEFMSKLARDHPEYIWEKNVGYPTRAHREAIKSAGVTPYHRMTFQLLPSQLELFENEDA